MINTLGQKQKHLLRKLSGKISDYKCTRAYASFVYSKADQDKLGVVAMAAALAGMGGQAASAAASASSTEEEADYVEFDLDGRSVKGWVWRSPFKNGDVVDVAAEWKDAYYEAYAIARPEEKMIALYPHCSRAKSRHIKNTIKWWFIWNLIFFGYIVAFALYMGGRAAIMAPELYQIGGAVALAFILMFISLSKQYMPFVRLSERVFIVLNLPSARNIDLVQSSRQERSANDPGEFGTFYFRY